MRTTTSQDIQATVDEIMARNRARFGHGQWFMEDTGGDAGDGASGDSGADDKAGDQDTGSGDAGNGTDDKAGDKSGDGDTGSKAEKVEDLPDWAQKQIKDLRKESGDRRTQANTAEQERQKLLDGIATALGIKKGEDAPTPEQLADQLTTSQTEAREAKVELAVFKAAAASGADPVALTDSRTFMTKVGALDPADGKFADKVKAEIETAVKDNPKLKSGQAPGSSAADHPGGSGGGGTKAKTLEEAVSNKMAR